MIVSYLDQLALSGEVSMDDLGRAEEPVIILAGPYGYPFRPILATVPIGAWVAPASSSIPTHAL